MHNLITGFPEEKTLTTLSLHPKSPPSISSSIINNYGPPQTLRTHFSVDHIKPEIDIDLSERSDNQQLCCVVTHSQAIQKQPPLS